MNNLSNIGTIKKILENHGFSFSKSLGQNFLVNPTVCPKIAEMGNAKQGFGIIEIGTGIGVLTKELCKRADKVVAIEIDNRLLPILNETLKDYDNWKIINEDVLKVDLEKVIKTEFQGMDVAICANLPYYITSPIIMNLLESRLPIKSITVMVQKEAATRICAMPATRDVGAVSLAVRYFSDPKLLFNVSRGSFMPAPNVDSAVIRLDILEKTPQDVKNEEFFFKLVRSSFSQRRKTLVNSVASMLSISKNYIIESLQTLNLNVNSRAEQMTLQNFIDLSNELINKI